MALYKGKIHTFQSGQEPFLPSEDVSIGMSIPRCKDMGEAGNVFSPKYPL